MLKRLGFGSPCPHCDKNILKLKKVGGIGFCRHCHTHLIIDNSEKQPSSKLQQALPHIFTLVTLLLFIVFFNNPVVNAFIKQNPKFVDHVFIICLCVFIVIVIIKIEVLAHDDYIIGIDSYETVQKEAKKDLYSRTLDASPLKLTCLHCSSQRLTTSYFFRRLTEQPILVKDLPYDNNFIGCLQCHSQFECKINNTDEIEKTIKVATFVGVFLFCIFVFNSYFIRCVNFLMMQLQELHMPFLPAFFIITNTLSLLTIAFTKNKAQTIQPTYYLEEIHKS